VGFNSAFKGLINDAETEGQAPRMLRRVDWYIVVSFEGS